MTRPAPICKHRRQTYHVGRRRALVDAVGRDEILPETLVHGRYAGLALPRQSLPGIKTIGDWNARHEQNCGPGVRFLLQPVFRHGIQPPLRTFTAEAPRSEGVLTPRCGTTPQSCMVSTCRDVTITC